MQAILVSLRASLCLIAFCAVLAGAIYPLAVTAIAQLAFPHQAGGSLILQEGKIIGSELLGQEFTSPRYFWGRLSATTPSYNAAASGGSNLGAANPKLLAAANQRLAAFKDIIAVSQWRVPIDLLTASASGLDPHLSLEAVLYQVPRVARARQMREEEIRGLIDQHLRGRQAVLLSSPYVNILLLNLALDGTQKTGKEK